MTWAAIISPVLRVLKWLAEKLGLVYLGKIITEKRYAEKSFRDAKEANEDWEEIRNLDAADLAERLRKSQR